MTFGGNNINYFPQSQLNKFNAYCSLNNKGKQKRQYKFKSKVTN